MLYAERLILETDQLGHIKNYPILPPNKQFEVIFLGLDEENETVKRVPHPDITGKVEIKGDILDSVPRHSWFSSL